jgi:hypothetical protein
MTRFVDYQEDEFYVPEVGHLVTFNLGSWSGTMVGEVTHFRPRVSRGQPILMIDGANGQDYVLYHTNNVKRVDLLTYLAAVAKLTPVQEPSVQMVLPAERGR